MKKNKEKKKNNSKIYLGIVILLVVVSFIFSNKAKQKEKQAVDDLFDKEIVLDVQDFDNQGANHISEAEGFEYNSNPPTSGPHLARAASWGFYKDEIVDEAALHALEHGGIWVSYKNISDEELDILKEFYNENPQAVVVSPREKNNSKIAITSWKKLVEMENVDLDSLRKYILLYKNNSPEKVAQ